MMLSTLPAVWDLEHFTNLVVAIPKNDDDNDGRFNWATRLKSSYDHCEQTAD